VPEEPLERSVAPKLSGLATVLAGIIVTGVGFTVFAGKVMDDPLAGSWPRILAMLSILVGVVLVEVGSWLNAAFYRALDKARARPWIEVAGGAALVVGAVVLGNYLALYWVGALQKPIVGLVAGLVLVELGLAAEHRGVIRMLTSPSFPLTLIVIAAGVLGAAALGLLSVINVRHYRRVDLTDQGIYTLDNRTMKILKSMDKRLRIFGAMVMTNNPRDDEANRVRERATEMLKEYAGQSRHVEFIQFNPYRDPIATRKLSNELGVDILRDSVIFEYEKKTKVIEFSELVDRGPFPGMPSAFKGEDAFTSALQGLVEGKTTKVYFVKGHGEKSLEEYDHDGISTLAELLRGDNCDVDDIELAEMPDECDVLVIAGPRQPFDPPEIAALREHVSQEHKGLIVLLDPAVGTTMQSGLESLLAEQGIVVRADETLVEMAQIEIMPGLLGSAPSATISATDYGGRPGAWGPPHPIVRDMKNIRTRFYLACPVSSMPGPQRRGPYGPQRDPSTAELVRTSSRSYAKADFDAATIGRIRIDRAADKPGPFTIAVARGNGMPPHPRMPMMRPPPAGRLVVFGDSDFVTNTFLEQGTTGNSTLFRNAVAWVAGKEYKIGIPPKRLRQERRLDIRSEDKAFARWATVIVPPFHILLIGIVVWWLRRR